jgi:hypothetical protein
MPPRKRAETKPAERQETAPEAETLPDDAAPAPATPEAEEAPNADAATPDAPGDDAKASDVQTVDRPCEECMPNGWPEGAFAVGCEHGTWRRTNT